MSTTLEAIAARGGLEMLGIDLVTDLDAASRVSRSTTPKSSRPAADRFPIDDLLAEIEGRT